MMSLNPQDYTQERTLTDDLIGAAAAAAGLGDRELVLAVLDALAAALANQESASVF